MVETRWNGEASARFSKESSYGGAAPPRMKINVSEAAVMSRFAGQAGQRPACTRYMSDKPDTHDPPTPNPQPLTTNPYFSSFAGDLRHTRVFWWLGRTALSILKDTRAGAEGLIRED